MWGAFGVLVFGLVIIMHWALAMFTDTGYGEFAREISSSMGTKNNLSLIFPAGGLMFVFGSVTMAVPFAPLDLANSTISSDRPTRTISLTSSGECPCTAMFT